MKKRIPTFLAGMVTMAVLLSFAMPALAAANEFLLNQVNVALHGKQVAAIGEDYTLSNGDKVPYSISYKGTTYLPIRKVGELVGQGSYWDGKTTTAGVGKQPYDPTAPIREVKDYEDFKAMWEMVKITPNGYRFAANCKSDDVNTFKGWWHTATKELKEEYIGKLAAEEHAKLPQQAFLEINFMADDKPYVDAMYQSPTSIDIFFKK